jgi:hypothetical protein
MTHDEEIQKIADGLDELESNIDLDVLTGHKDTRKISRSINESDGYMQRRRTRIASNSPSYNFEAFDNLPIPSTPYAVPQPPAVIHRTVAEDKKPRQTVRQPAPKKRAINAPNNRKLMP